MFVKIYGIQISKGLDKKTNKNLNFCADFSHLIFNHKSVVLDSPTSELKIMCLTCI